MKEVDSPQRILLVTLGLCIICAGLVSSSVVLLRPIQERNQQLDRKRNILLTTGLLAENSDDKTVLSLFEHHVRSVELKTPFSTRTVYEILEKKQLRNIVLPIEGKGLWSTMYGFLALKADANTIAGLRFYQHGETPGLGGEVDNPLWLALWPGKQLFDPSGNYRLELLKGRVDRNKGEAMRHQVDGLSGATLTTQGIQRFLRESLGPNVYGPYLKELRARQGDPSHGQ